MSKNNKTKTVNWDMIIPPLKRSLIAFANGQLSGRQLYDDSKAVGVSPEVRSLVRSGVSRARSLSQKALRRRSLIK